MTTSADYYKIVKDVLERTTPLLRNGFRFQWRQLTQGDWFGSYENIQQLVQLLGRNDVPASQIVLVIVKTLDHWNLPLLCLIHQHLEHNEQTKNAISSIFKINDSLNTTTKQLDKAEFVSKMHRISNALKFLGMSHVEIDKFTKRFRTTVSTNALRQAEKLFAEAEDFLKQGDPKNAERNYTLAIELPDLLPNDLGLAYQKRAEFYLKQVTDLPPGKTALERALRDSIKAIEYNDQFWKGHYSLAQSLWTKGDIGKAAQAYVRAVAICPSQARIESELTSCRLLEFANDMTHPPDPEELVLSVNEDGEWEDDFDEEEEATKCLDKMNLKVDTNSPFLGTDIVMRGLDQYTSGDDLFEAFKRFRQAAQMRNPVGKYFLGLCYFNGTGVGQDHFRALELFKEVVEMEETWPGLSVPYRGNLAIASAQLLIGLMYHEGIGVGTDYDQAAFWYQKAMENGSAIAANNLGCMYASIVGGVKRCDIMAEMCLLEAIKLNVAPPYEWLVKHYVVKQEPDKVERFFEIGKEMMCNDLLEMREDFLHTLAYRMRKFREEIEDDVKKFENDHKLTSKGLTFKDRLDRKQGTSGAWLKAYVMNTIASHFLRNELHDIKPHPLTSEMIEEIQTRAKEGSQTAQRIDQALYIADILKDVLNEVQDNFKDITQDQKETVLDLLYELMEKGYRLIPMFDLPIQKIREILRFLRFGITYDQPYRPENFDMKLRLCYVAYKFEHFSKARMSTEAEDLLKQGIQRYPENHHFYILLANIYKNRGDWASVNRYLVQGLHIYSTNLELLYLNAILHENTSSSSSDWKECVEKYHQFLNLAPKDHELFPDGMYGLSCSIFRTIKRAISAKENISRVQDSWIDEMLKYFEVAQSTEKDQMPCFLPYKTSKVVAVIQEFSKSNILEKKVYLKNPTRQLSIRLHRRDFMQKVSHTENKFDKMVAQKETQALVKDMPALRSITMDQMIPITTKHIFNNTVIQLTVLDEPAFIDTNLLSSVVEDKNGDVMRLHIHDIVNMAEMMNMFSVGCRIAVVNPDVQVGGRNEHDSLQIYILECIIYLGRVENMCGFCGEDKASYRCPKCKILYCGKSCLSLDKERHDHELICWIKCNSS